MGFSPVLSSTPILMRVTCRLVEAVQMVRTNPDRNFSLGIFAYRFYKPSTNRFSHLNGKQPMKTKFSFPDMQTTLSWKMKGHEAILSLFLLRILV